MVVGMVWRVYPEEVSESLKTFISVVFLFSRIEKGGYFGKGRKGRVSYRWVVSAAVRTGVQEFRRIQANAVRRA